MKPPVTRVKIGPDAVVLDRDNNNAPIPNVIEVKIEHGVKRRSWLREYVTEAGGKVRRRVREGNFSVKIREPKP